MDPTTIPCAAIQNEGGRRGPTMRSTPRDPSALALQIAARTSAGTSPADLGEGRLLVVQGKYQRMEDPLPLRTASMT